MIIVTIFGLPNTSEFKEKLPKLEARLIELFQQYSRIVTPHFPAELTRCEALGGPDKINVSCIVYIAGVIVDNKKDLREELDGIIEVFCEDCKPKIKVNVGCFFSDVSKLA